MRPEEKADRSGIPARRRRRLRRLCRRRCRIHDVAVARLYALTLAAAVDFAVAAAAFAVAAAVVGAMGGGRVIVTIIGGVSAKLILENLIT